MNIWSLHPKYLDRRELLSVWENGLKALELLSNKKSKDIFYPELSRFRMHSRPKSAIVQYLQIVAIEASKRNISIDTSVLPRLTQSSSFKIPINAAEIEYEWKALLRNQGRRSPRFVRSLGMRKSHDPHPLFYIREDGSLPAWQRLAH